MKANTLSSLLKLAIAGILISTVSACSDEPPPAMPYLKEYVFPGGCVFPIIVCSMPGNDCEKLGPNYGLRTEGEYERFSTFYRMIGHDSASYFLQYYEWRDILPGLESRNELVANIINEVYKVKIMADSSIVILSGEEITEENIVFAFDYDGRVSCDQY